MNMKNMNAKSKCLLPAAMAVALMNASILSAETKSWQDETVLISPQGDQTVVRSLKGDGQKILFKNADPQLAIEWGLANARTTVVLAGKYVVDDTVDVPRDGVTLIIDRGAVIAMNPKTEHKTDLGFRSTGNFWQIVPLIYNRGRNNVRVISFGRLLWFCTEKGVPRKGGKGRQTFPIVFDGRKGGLKGGMMLVCGATHRCCWLIDCDGVEVPLRVKNGGAGGTPLGMEGCSGCKVGMIVNLPQKNRDPKAWPHYHVKDGKPVPPSWPPDGMTYEALDLNSSNQGITVERIIAERRLAKPGMRSCEIVDCNASRMTIGEIVLVGELGNEHLHLCTKGSGPRFTRKGRPAAGIVVGRDGKTCSKMTCLGKDCKGGTILKDATMTVREDVPKLPDALPRFTVKATVEVTLKDGGKKTYTKAVEIDVRAGGPKLKPIFNGKDLSGWKVPDKNIWWKVNDGILSCKSGPKRRGSILWTEKKYKNFIIETDFRFGEGTVDSGIFLRTTRQQVQMGISGSLKRDMTCSIYVPGKGYPKEAQGVKQLLKPRDWNTIRVKAVGGVYTMTLNGKQVLVFDGGKDAIEEGPIGLQLHGGKVMAIDFRNIRLAELE